MAVHSRVGRRSSAEPVPALFEPAAVPATGTACAAEPQSLGGGFGQWCGGYCAEPGAESFCQGYDCSGTMRIDRCYCTQSSWSCQWQECPPGAGGRRPLDELRRQRPLDVLDQALDLRDQRRQEARGGSLPAMKASIIEQVQHLPVEQRIELAEAIWDTIPEDADAAALPLSEAHRAELDRRLADWEADPDAGSSWEEVRSRLERRQ